MNTIIKINILMLLLLLNTISKVVAGEIAITFDDAPTVDSSFMSGAEKTAKIIEGLQAAKVERTLVFVSTQHVNNKSRTRLLSYLSHGYDLANHGHEHLSANKINLDEFKVDLNRADNILGEFEGELKYYRFPFLHYGATVESRQAIQSILKKKGYSMGYVTVDNYEWYLNAKLVEAHANKSDIDYEKMKQLYLKHIWDCIEFYDNIARSSLGRSPKHVLLLHENELAALYIRDVVEHIRSKGWKIISPQQAYTDPISKMDTNKFAFNKQGRVAAIAHSKGWDINSLRHPAENTQYLDKQFVREKIFRPRNAVSHVELSRDE